jgi:hypothetical protein
MVTGESKHGSELETKEKVASTHHNVLYVSKERNCGENLTMWTMAFDHE